MRRDVQRRPEGSEPAFDPEVFGARFLLTRRPDKLDAADRKGALEALDRFADIYRTAQIPEFSDTVDTFLAWHHQILDWHQTGRRPNGRIDRTNNLLQVLRRKAHGITNYTNSETRGLLLTRTPPSPAAPIPQIREGSIGARVRYSVR
ncbi:transposase [Candidatus Poriferisodalis sp.]|uniref:transposase n=1 Tax=Candidatus Poriferisodalis sp. TaxID=3101277 RepID=UPI003D13706B